MTCASRIMRCASCTLLTALVCFTTACSPPPRTIAFAWDGETFRQQDAPGVITQSAPPETIQQADLDDDGAPETVELRDGVLRLTDDGRVVWQSDLAWNVIRFALTDVDNDGAPDIFFVLWKPDEAGVSRCHPFIYGWSRDAWRPRWFGSAVADPILDFVVGDVDGDGRNELVVLEGLPSPVGRGAGGEGLPSPSQGEGAGVRVGTHITIWRFNQWWFQLLWRSDPGDYCNLTLKDVTGDGVPDIVTNLKPQAPKPKTPNRAGLRPATCDL